MLPAVLDGQRLDTQLQDTAFWDFRGCGQLQDGAEWGAAALFQAEEISHARSTRLPQECWRGDPYRRQDPSYDIRGDQEAEQGIRLALQYHAIILRSQQGLLHGAGEGREETDTAQLRP